MNEALTGLKRALGGLTDDLSVFVPLLLVGVLVVSVNLILKIRKAWRKG